MKSIKILCSLLLVLTESPAVSARDMIMNILNFYNKDMYNQ